MMSSEHPTGGRVSRGQWLMVALSIGLALAVALSMALAGDAQAKKKKKTATKTFTFSNTQLIQLPSVGIATPYPSQINVNIPKTVGGVLDVNVKLNGFSHQFSDDADVLLVSPGGQNAIIFSDVGGNNPATNFTLTLDDESANTLPDTTAIPGSGTFQPVNFAANQGDNFPGAPTPSGATALSTFDGINPNGAWRLFVSDDTAGGTPSEFSGGWTLEVQQKVKKKKKKR